MSNSFKLCPKHFFRGFEKNLSYDLRTIFNKYSNTTHASNDVTTFAIIKPRKHQRLADPLLQSGVVTRNNCV